MKFFFIKDENFDPFLDNMVRNKNVYAPVARKTKFVFSKVSSPREIRLDYDVTLLPPKKEFFPTCQSLLKFNKDGFEDCIAPEEKIIFGMHFYDMKAIDMTDHLFRERNEDWNYLANREAATIILTNVQSVAPRSFWGTIGKDIRAKGHDGTFTKIPNGYLYHVRTKKGEALLEYGNFQVAENDHIKEGDKVNIEIMDKCPQEIKTSSRTLAATVRDSFKKHSLWSEMAHDCFSCGSCNTTCPTCYCFDVQDKWNVDQVSGERKRYWDACLTEEFAEISLGGGAKENFRESRGDRFRHRVMRKMSYLNEKFGAPACVGCGRCANACTADIADPVSIVNKIMEVQDV